VRGEGWEEGRAMVGIHFISPSPSLTHSHTHFSFFFFTFFH
jgi:hypothetical protein